MIVLFLILDSGVKKKGKKITAFRRETLLMLLKRETKMIYEVPL